MSASSHETGIGRRDILCSGGSAVFSSLIAALLGNTKPAQAQTISGSVPEVDRAAIRVVTDNYHFALSPSGKIGDVMVERIVFPLSDKPPGKVLLSEFGLSMHLETQRENETRNVLIDFGYSSPTLLNNIDILGIDPAKLDAMVLSHGQSFRRHGWISRGHPGKTQAQAAALYRRRGMLLLTSVHCRADAAQFWGT
jgi:7,8-dihydropterin-6-yl-methyl-4-(beta-D-ribofuranosyl)aminobenzene 5'-phosphate synthase